MAFCDSRPLTFIIYSGFLVFLADARSWDLAVTIGREVHFFANNGTMTGRMKTRDAVDLSGIAYDDSTHSMFLSDTKNTNLTIFSKNLSSKNFDMNKILESESRAHIIGLIYDSVTQNLYWADAKEQAIMTMHVSSNKSASGEASVLLKLPNKSPRGISLDACNRRLYWANSNSSHPSIESCKLDGSDNRTVISEKLYEPLGVTVDHWTAKLYWIDDEEGVYYKIERSNLDGTNRELLVHGRHQQPYNIAVDRKSVYWTDWSYSAVWSIKKHAEPGENHAIWASFHDSNRDSDPKSIVTRDNIGDYIDCPAMHEAENRNTVTSISEPGGDEEESDNNLATSTEVGDSTPEGTIGCLNGGHHDEALDICRCKSGYYGSFCERSMCHNYCLHGECYMTASGQPSCKCGPSFQGPRCEQNICDGFCLNDGQCSIKNYEPYCTCKNSRGPRCEDVHDVIEICALFCSSDRPSLSTIDTSSCACSPRNETMGHMGDFGQDKWCKTMTIIFSTLLAVLTILVAVLSYYVNKLRRRPRIRKRFVVSKTGITPLTARPQLPSDQCEIMIENCCNMNICETPCFEPKLRSSESNNHKKDEKNSLLDNMDGNSC